MTIRCKFVCVVSFGIHIQLWGRLCAACSVFDLELKLERIDPIYTSVKRDIVNWQYIVKLWRLSCRSFWRVMLPKNRSGVQIKFWLYHISASYSKPCTETTYSFSVTCSILVCFAPSRIQFLVYPNYFLFVFNWNDGTLCLYYCQ